MKDKIPNTIKLELLLLRETPDKKKDHTFIKSTSKERRKHTREFFNCPLLFVYEGKYFKGTSRDLSHSGIYVESFDADQFKINDFISLALHTSNNDYQKHEGRIVRKDNEGFGIQFLPSYG